MKEKIMEIVTSSKSIIVITICLCLLLIIVLKNPYINCLRIIKMHAQCFRCSNGRYSKNSIFIYFIMPLVMATIFAYVRIIDDDVINILTVIISILTSMFFTVITLILDMRKRVISDCSYNANDASVVAKILKETYYTIMFEILVSILILIMCFITLFGKMYCVLNSITIYYLTFLLLFNLFIVLKRIFNVVDKDMNVNDS